MSDTGKYGVRGVPIENFVKGSLSKKKSSPVHKALERKKSSVKGMGKLPSDHYGVRIPAYEKPKYGKYQDD